MKTYIHKSSIEPIQIEDIGREVFIGETWQDYLDGKWVELSEQQLAFRDEHPEASIKEVFDMQMTPPPEPPEQPEPPKQPFYLTNEVILEGFNYLFGGGLKNE